MHSWQLLLDIVNLVERAIQLIAKEIWDTCKFKSFLLEYNLFTVLCQYLLYSKVTQFYTYILCFLNVNLQCRRPGFNTWFGKIPWRREQLPTAIFLLGECHGQRSLAGYSPWGCKELDATKVTYTRTHASISRNILPIGGNTLIWLQPSHLKEVGFWVPDRFLSWWWWREAQTSRQKNGTCILSARD